MSNDPKYIAKKYFSSSQPGSLGGIKNFLINNKYKNIASIKNIIKDIYTYGVHRPKKKVGPRRKVVAIYNGQFLAADLGQVTQLSPPLNGGIKNLLIIVEILTKLVKIYPLKKKSGKLVSEAFDEHLHAHTKHRGSLIWIDRATEFLNKDCTKVLEKYGCKFYHSYNLVFKSVYSEIFVKIVKLRIAHYLEHNKTKRYIDAIPGIERAINMEKKDSTGYAPLDIKTLKDESIAWYRQYKSIIQQKRVPPKLKLAEIVRISRDKLLFEKVYSINWSPELFRISKIIPSWPIYVYKLSDLNGLELPSTYYDFELQVVPTTKNNDDA